jgi:hypothetical protein
MSRSWDMGFAVTSISRHKKNYRTISNRVS